MFKTGSRTLYITAATVSLFGSGLFAISQAAVDNKQAAGTESSEKSGDWSGKGSQNDKRPVSAGEIQKNKDTAKAVSRIPGVDTKPQDLQPPEAEKPIHGFHPIKKLLQPIVQLEKNSTELEQQIMKLEGPIAGLQPPMLSLDKKMTSVEGKMGSMQKRLDSVDGHMGGVGGQMVTIATQMTEIRTDLSQMHKQIGQLQVPIEELRKPLLGVSKPLSALDAKIDKLVNLLTIVLFTIVLAAIGTAIGTPLAATWIYKNRKKFFPGIDKNDLPGRRELDRVA